MQRLELVAQGRIAATAIIIVHREHLGETPSRYQRCALNEVRLSRTEQRPLLTYADQCHTYTRTVSGEVTSPAYRYPQVTFSRTVWTCKYSSELTNSLVCLYVRTTGPGVVTSAARLTPCRFQMRTTRGEDHSTYQRESDDCASVCFKVGMR